MKPKTLLALLVGLVGSIWILGATVRAVIIISQISPIATLTPDYDFVKRSPIATPDQIRHHYGGNPRDAPGPAISPQVAPTAVISPTISPLLPITGDDLNYETRD